MITEPQHACTYMGTRHCPVALGTTCAAAGAPCARFDMDTEQAEALWAQEISEERDMNAIDSRCYYCGKPFEDGESVVRHESYHEVMKGSGPDQRPSMTTNLIAERMHAACEAAPDPKGQRLRITSYGSFADTRVLLVQPDGTEIPVTDLIRAVTIHVVDQDLATAVVTFERVEVDVVATTPDLTDQLT